MSAEVTTQLLLLFILMSSGFFVRKTNIISKEISGVLSSVISKVTMPALYIATLMQTFSFERMKNSAVMLLLAGIFYIISISISLLFCFIFKAPKNDKGVIQFMLIFSNAAFMGYPVLDAIFGLQSDVRFGAVFFNLPFNLLAFTLGVWLLTRDIKDKPQLSKKTLLLNPGTLSVFIGLIFFLISPFVPGFLSDFIYDGPIHNGLLLLGNTTTPLSMIVIGAVLADISIKYALTYWRIYLISVFRLLVIPIVLFGVLSLLGISGLTIGIPVVISGMPVAVFSVILAKEYGGNVELASIGVFFTTLLSFVTIPIISMILG